MGIDIKFENNCTIVSAEMEREEHLIFSKKQVQNWNLRLCKIPVLIQERPKALTVTL